MEINITLFIQVVAFLVLIYFVRKVLWGPMVSAMEARQKKIEDGLEAANEGRNQLEKAEENARDILAEAKKEASSMLDDTHKREAEIIEAAKEAAIEEANKIRLANDAAVEQQISSAREALREEVGSLVIEAAKKVIMRELDDKKHADIIQDATNKLAS